MQRPSDHPPPTAPGPTRSISPRRRGLVALPAMMCLMLGLFMVNAAFGSWFEGYVKARTAEQFIPIGTFFLAPLGVGDMGIAAFALACKLVIGIVEFAAGGMLILAAVLPRHRMALASYGCTVLTALFGIFLITLYAMHDYNLPRWTQFPALFTWIAATWLLVAWSDRERAPLRGS